MALSASVRCVSRATSERRLTDKDGNVTVLENAETDLYLRYGWTIPVRSLRFWALGIPDPAIPADTEFGDDGHLSALSQGGWTVQISRYGEGGGQSMPTRLSAVSESTKVKLVIHRWAFLINRALITRVVDTHWAAPHNSPHDRGAAIRHTGTPHSREGRAAIRRTKHSATDYWGVAKW